MENLRELRKEKGLTLGELSTELKGIGLSISPNSLGKYEQGLRTPRLETMNKLAQYFNVPIDYLQDKGISKEELLNYLVLKFYEQSEVIAPWGEKASIGEFLSHGFSKQELNEFDDILDDRGTNLYIGERPEVDEYVKKILLRQTPLLNDYRFLSSQDRKRYKADDIVFYFNIYDALSGGGFNIYKPSTDYQNKLYGFKLDDLEETISKHDMDIGGAAYHGDKVTAKMLHEAIGEFIDDLREYQKKLEAKMR